MAVLFVKSLLPTRRQSYSPMSSGANDDVEASIPLSFARHSHDSDAVEKAMDLSCDSSDDSSDPDANFRAHLISNFTIGFSDGLTVPFAVTAGLSALGNPRVVIFGGLSELIAGTISMGMGGYLGAKGEVDAYAATLTQTQTTVRTSPSATTALLTKSLSAAHLPPSLLEPAIAHLLDRPAECTDFLMRFHHHLPASSFPRRYALFSGLVICVGYVSGGIVPLLPYLFLATIDAAFAVSIVVTALVLLGFGWAKTWVVGERDFWKCARGSAEMFCLGGLAAAAAVGCVKAFS